MAESTRETPVLDLLKSRPRTRWPRRVSIRKRPARVAALVAVDAPAVSYLMNLEAISEAGIDPERVRGVLAAVAPIVGTARVASATGHIVDALDIAIEVAELEQQSTT